MAVPPGKDSCRKCGGPMERGSIAGDAGYFNRFPATILWSPEQPGSLPGDLSGEIRLARLPVFRSASPRFPALLCPSCHRVEFQFTETARQAFP
jgi:hypothetical protein